MTWNKQVPFVYKQKNKYAPSSDTNTTSSVWSKQDFEDGTYYEEFLKDWEKCRTRHDGQQRVIDSYFKDGAQYIFLKAGRKFAKTATGIDIAWRAAAQIPNCVVYFCYPTIALGIEVLWDEQRLQRCDLRKDTMKDKYVEKTDDNKHMVRFKNGSYMKLIGTWSESRGRGTQPDLLVVDEIQDCSGVYLDAMDPNLAAKNGRCVMVGTPPQKRNHWYQWWDRVVDNPRGKTFHFTSYDNKSLPHLEEWLDRKKIELTKAGKEDVWIREYMADDCFSNSERVLPDAVFKTDEEINTTLSHFGYKDRIPVLAIGTQGKYLCAILAIVIRRKMIFIMDKEMHSQIWNKSFAEMFPELGEKCKRLQDECGTKMRKILWDPTNSFNDVIPGFGDCIGDKFKWQNRGVPLLKEMMVNKTIFVSEKLGDFGFECQGIFRDESVKDVEKDYPYVSTLSMLVNEYFSLERDRRPVMKEFDKYQGLREMGIPIPVKKRTGVWL